MRVMLVTTPIRPQPTDYPPFGSLSIVKYLRRHGVQGVEFYNIDGNRPSYAEVLAHIKERRPDVLGISAVVSTAYEYTKRLAVDVKKMLPDTLIVVGGNMAASAEILLRRASVDLCVLSEGEKVFLNVVRRAERTRVPTDYADIPGLALLGADGALVNTGYEETLAAEELYDIDWDDLDRSSDMGVFIYSAFDELGESQAIPFTYDGRAFEEHRRHKKVGRLVASKGCVARCTFCHRWDKGIRYIPVDILMRRIEELVKRYDVGFLCIADENFGTDRRWLTQFCDGIKKFDILWRVAGMRVNRIDRETILMMRDAGCVYIAYGMETGSARILEIMEKKTSIEANYTAIKWTIDANLGSPVQIVIGMPGETDETVDETIQLCIFSQTLSPKQNPNDLSINYAQALPGTPLYEFARHKGLIGRTLEEEEVYLLRISDRDAHDEFSTLNFTETPRLICETWRPRITVEVNYAYVKKYGLDHYLGILLNDVNYFRKERKDTGYFANPKRLVDRSATTDTLHEVRSAMLLDEKKPELPRLSVLLAKGNLGLAMICYPVFFYRLKRFLPLMVLIKDLVRFGPRYAGGLVLEYLGFLFRGGARFGHKYRSLRKIVNEDIGPLPDDSPAMQPLRQGR